MLGATYFLLQGNPTNSVMISGQLNNPNDNAESFNIGVEYGWKDILMLRAGYRFGVEEVQIPGLGFGLIIPGIGPEVRWRDHGGKDYIRSRLQSKRGSRRRLSPNFSLVAGCIHLRWLPQPSSTTFEYACGTFGRMPPHPWRRRLMRNPG